MTDDIAKISMHLAKKHPAFDRDELFQVGYLAGLEAKESGNNVYSQIRREIYNHTSMANSPVVIPDSGQNNTALSRLRSGEEPISRADLRIAALLMPIDEVLSITATTTETPETLLIKSQSMERVNQLFKYQHFWLTPIQIDAISSFFFGEPTQDAFCKKYQMSCRALRNNKDVALDKVRRLLRSV